MLACQKECFACFASSWTVDGHLRCVLQALAASTTALIGVSQLFVPNISFFKDMWPHTDGFKQNPVLLSVYTICFLLLITWTLDPGFFGSTHGKVWHSFPFRIRLHMLALIIATGAVSILLSNLRRYLQLRLWRRSSNAVVPTH